MNTLHDERFKIGIIHVQKRVFIFKGVPNGMKGVFECLSQKYGGSYKHFYSTAGMIETSAASHMILKVILNGILPVNRI
jgi:hypothetical protein